MNGLREVATKYHRQANAIAARGDIAGQLTPDQQAGIKYYRDCAEKVEALIRPEDEQAEEATWHLEGEERQPAGPHKGKVTSADKAATPQELIKKAG
jgi:hypothetical protein